LKANSTITIEIKPNTSFYVLSITVNLYSFTFFSVTHDTPTFE